MKLDDIALETSFPVPAKPAGSRLRINWINPRPNLSGGVKSNRLIAEAMVRRGHDVRIVYVSAPRPKPGIRHPIRRLARMWKDLRCREEEEHHLQSSTATFIPVGHQPIGADDVPDADVSIGTWWETMEWVQRFPASKGIKAYFVRHHELHGGDPDRVKATYFFPSLKLVIAKWLQRLMIETYGCRDVVLVPNGVDWNQFGSPPREKPEVPLVGMLYGPQDWKGAAAAFDALRLLQQRMPQVQVEAFGRVALRRSDRPPANFRFHLRPSQSTIPELYRRASCWLVPSRLEGFGMPGLEAAACRCPIVATRSGGPEDYVDDGRSGYLVPVDDCNAISKALENVLSAPAANWKAMSEASYQMAQYFNWDRSAELLENALIAAVRSGAN